MRALLFLSLLAACGKVNSLTDAGGGDGKGADANTTIDAAGPDADPHGSITVLVNAKQGPATPQAGVPVVFVDPDGTIVAEVPTGSDGKATATVLPGATVTAVYDAGTTTVQLETVRAVAPGDTIVIGPLSGSNSGSGSFTANVPDYPGSQSYDVYGPCGSGNGTAAGSGSATPVSLFISDNCKEATMDLLAIARNSDRIADAWLEQKNVAYVDGGSDDMAGTWQGFQTLTATFQNQPSNVSLIYVTDSGPDANGYQYSNYAQGSPAIATLTVPGPATALVETNFTNSLSGGQQQMYEVVDGTKTDYTVDLATALLPFVPFPTLDVSTKMIAVGSGTAGDVLDVTVSYQRVVSTTTYTYTWEVWSPPQDDLTLPPMPTDLAATRPMAGDTVTNTYTNLYGADAITAWAQVRGRLFGAFDAYYAGRSTLGTGRLIWSYPTGVGFTARRRTRR